MYHVIIIDDDPNMLETIQSEFEQLEMYEISAFSATSQVTTEILNKSDILFLDIELKGENGILYAKEIQSMYPQLAIIFMTNHDSYVFDTYLLKTLFFIRKGNFKTDFKNALKKWNTTYSLNNNVITIKVGSDMQYLKASDIIYGEKKDNKLIIYRNGQLPIETYDTIRCVIEQSPENLCLINKSIFINLDYVDTYDSTYVYLTSKIKIDISRRKRKEFKNALFSFRRKTF